MQIKYTEDGGVATYDYSDFTSGLIPQGRIDTSSSSLRANGHNGFSRISNMDPITTNGVLCPAYNLTANATGNASLGGRVMSFSLENNNGGYGIDIGGKINRATLTTPEILTGGSYPHTITGTSPVGQDTIIYSHYQAGSLVTSIFYSYYNNANWNVGILASSFATPDDDFMSAEPDTPLDITTGDGDDTNQRTKAHPMEIGADGILYIGSGRYLHAYDGTVAGAGGDGIFYSKVLTLPIGTEIVAMRNFNEKLLIATNYSPSASQGDAEVYVWNYLDLDPTTVISLEDITVSSIFLWQGTPAVTTQGISDRNGLNKLKTITGNTVKTIASWNGSAPINRGIVVNDEMVHMNCGGRIISVGSIYKQGNMVNNLASFPLVSGTLGGCLFYRPLGDNLCGSVTDNGTHYFQRTTADNSTNTGSVYFPQLVPDFPFGKRGRITHVEVEYYTPLTAAATNGTFTLTLLSDNTTTSTVISAKNDVVVPLGRRYTRDTSGAILPHFNTLVMGCSWGAGTVGLAPRINKISIEWELVEITN
jgi:hypothetical protein